MKFEKSYSNVLNNMQEKDRIPDPNFLKLRIHYFRSM